MEATSGQVAGALLLFVAFVLAIPVLTERRAKRIRAVGLATTAKVLSTKWHAGGQYQASVYSMKVEYQDHEGNTITRKFNAGRTEPKFETIGVLFDPRRPKRAVLEGSEVPTPGWLTTLGRLWWLPTSLALAGAVLVVVAPGEPLDSQESAVESLTFEALLADPEPHLGEMRILEGTYMPVTPVTPVRSFGTTLSEVTIDVSIRADATDRSRPTQLKVLFDDSPTGRLASGQSIRMGCTVSPVLPDPPRFVHVTCGPLEVLSD